MTNYHVDVSAQQRIDELTQRVEFLERAIMLMINSAGYYELGSGGIALTDRAYNEPVPQMIAGNIPWNPQSLDKGG